VFSPAGAAPATASARKLLDALSRPFIVSGHRLSVGASCGVAHAAQSPLDLAALMRQADLALNQAKSLGGRRLALFDATLENEQMLRLELEQELAGAIDRGEMELAYQPQFTLLTGEIVGAEALLRWRHPVRGFISPGVFIPLAEASGDIHALTAFVLDTACRDARNFPTPIKIAVNISPADLLAGSVPELIAVALEETGLRPEFLEVEITESGFIQGGAAVAETFDRIRRLGVGIALDDFGTGYSSLGYLHKFPFTKLKIDRSFVTGIPDDTDAMTILRSIFVLAQGLGLKTIAEGIETAEQQETLLSLGCKLGQGYLFAKPMAFEQLVRTHLAPIPADVAIAS
jgi:EAL domain-containing protein (putative c-di-GMP-specific phosphodiesterase class I)